MRYDQISSTAMLATALFAMASCSQDDPDIKKAAEGSLIASVDGVEWISDNPTALIYQRQIQITGKADDGSKLVIYLTNDEEGSYSISGIPVSLHVNVGSFTPPNSSTTNPAWFSTNLVTTPAGATEISEIDEINKTLSGTFHFKATRIKPEETTIEIKSGSFTRIPYSDRPGIVAGDKCSFMVNGAAFEAIQIDKQSNSGNLILNIVGVGGMKLVIMIPENISAGTYDLAQATDVFASYIDNLNIYQSTAGSLVITGHDTVEREITGTFSFDGQIVSSGTGVVTIREGSFDIRY